MRRSYRLMANRCLPLAALLAACLAASPVGRADLSYRPAPAWPFFGTMPPESPSFDPTVIGLPAQWPPNSIHFQQLKARYLRTMRAFATRPRWTPRNAPLAHPSAATRDEAPDPLNRARDDQELQIDHFDEVFHPDEDDYPIAVADGLISSEPPREDPAVNILLNRSDDDESDQATGDGGGRRPRRFGIGVRSSLMYGRAESPSGRSSPQSRSGFKPSGEGLELEGQYYLDWPWAQRPGTNLFYWIFGPPAGVAAIVAAAGIVAVARREAV